MPPGSFVGCCNPHNSGAWKPYGTGRCCTASKGEPSTWKLRALAVVCQLMWKSLQKKRADGFQCKITDTNDALHVWNDCCNKEGTLVGTPDWTGCRPDYY